MNKKIIFLFLIVFLIQIVNLVFHIVLDSKMIDSYASLSIVSLTFGYVIVSYFQTVENKLTRLYSRTAEVLVVDVGISFISQPKQSTIDVVVAYTRTIYNDIYDYKIIGICQIGECYYSFTEAVPLIKVNNSDPVPAHVSSSIALMNEEQFSKAENALVDKNIKLYLFLSFRNESSGYYQKKYVFQMNNDFTKSDQFELVKEKAIREYTAKLKNEKMRGKWENDDIKFSVHLSEEKQFSCPRNEIDEKIIQIMTNIQKLLNEKPVNYENIITKYFYEGKKGE